MPNRLESLLSEAQSEPSLNRPRYAQYRPIVRTLLEKGWSYRRIFEWLIAKGEPLEEKNFSRFRVALSTANSRSKRIARLEAETRINEKPKA